MKSQLVFLVMLIFSLVSMIAKINEKRIMCPNFRSTMCLEIYDPVCAYVIKSKRCSKFINPYTAENACVGCKNECVINYKKGRC